VLTEHGHGGVCRQSDGDRCVSRVLAAFARVSCMRTVRRIGDGRSVAKRLSTAYSIPANIGARSESVTTKVNRMETRFIAIGDSTIPLWSNYFRAANAWLMSLQTLMENHLGTGWGVFYVEPTIVALCIEMYSKALASNLDDSFRATDFGHTSKKLIVEYQNRLPLFARIAADAE
jgi:hypothetical protein